MALAASSTGVTTGGVTSTGSAIVIVDIANSGYALNGNEQNNIMTHDEAKRFFVVVSEKK
jgi:hypothetical protein